jgi:LIVCS family branched-chain amino acid:cation transporter
MAYNWYARVVTIGLAIFAMLFGAGNLIFPLRLGVHSGGHLALTFGGFALGGILLPVLGLLAIVLYHGSYEDYFGTLGKRLGSIFIFCCMMIIGPFLVMPRIMALSYDMLYNYMPPMSVFVFSILFSSIAFLFTCRLGKVLDLVGNYLSPIKVAGLLFIVGTGLWYSPGVSRIAIDHWDLFKLSLVKGYGTLDLLATIFFGAIIVRLLTRYADKSERIDMADAIKLTTIAGLCAGGLLGVVYLGMIYLGSAYGEGLLALHEGKVFSTVALRILGDNGAILVGLVVFIAGLVTVVSLTTVVGEYVNRLMPRRLTYVQAVIAVLLICSTIASTGLDNIIDYSEPFIAFFYPLIIVITVCNVLRKLVGFTYIRLPLAITAVCTAYYTLPWHWFL